MMTLAEYLERSATTQAQFAERLGCDQSTVCRILKDGPRRMETARRIEILTDGAVPVSAWSVMAENAPAASDCQPSFDDRVNGA
jgi:transcriptional regulator with XRE-family HTH domain